MHNHTMWLIARVFIGLLASASWAGAQPAADEFNRLNDYLRLGDAVIVTDLTGRNLRGTVQALAPDSIEVAAVASKPRTIPARDVSLVRLEKSDRLLNGVGLGALIGAGLGVVWGTALAGDGNEIVNTVGLLGVSAAPPAPASVPRSTPRSPPGLLSIGERSRSRSNFEKYSALSAALALFL